MNCNDLRQAISDISLQLNVTVIFLLVLVIVGVLFALVSRLLTDRIQPKKPLKQQPVAIPTPDELQVEITGATGAVYARTG